MDGILQKNNETYKFYKGRYPLISEDVWNKYLAQYEQLFAKIFDKFNEGKQISVPMVLSVFGWKLNPK